MTTQPPSPEAVEAALKRAEEDLGRDERHSAALGIKPAIERADRESQPFRDRQTLADEVERLRAQADAVCEWTGFSAHGRIHYRTCRGVLNYTEMPRLQFIPFCPGCGRKVKIQPQNNEE